MSDNHISKPPAKVILATNLFYSIIGIGLLRRVMTIVEHWHVRSPDSLIIRSVIIWLLSIFLIYKTRKGCNWAKWSMVAILAISLPLSILPMFDSITHSPIPNLLGLTQVILYIWALVLLFHQTSSDWFARKDK